jgi:hypothetical protein
VANYPNSVPSFATINAGDVVQPSHPNSLGDEITAIGTGLLTGLSHTLTLNSGQIIFPANQNAAAGANTLDDYEEGTWTPTIGGTGGQSGQVYNFQYGTYVKIGQMVFATFNVALSTLGTITTSAQVQGLPFTINNLNTNYAPTTTGLFWANTTTALVTIVGIGVANTTGITLFGAAAATTGITALVQASLSNTTQIAGTLIYRASA